MKTKRTIATIIGLAALAALMTLGIFHGTRPVQAQDQIPPPQPDRISFGMVGITQGQTIRLNVANTIPYDAAFPPGPTRVVLDFLDAEGRLWRNRAGQPIRRDIMLQPGRATFIDLDADDLQFPDLNSMGPRGRIQLRAVVSVIPPPIGDTPPPIGDQPPPIGDRIVPSVEIFNSANAKTVLFIGNPGVIRGFNPQPDPPLGQ